MTSFASKLCLNQSILKRAQVSRPASGFFKDTTKSRRFCSSLHPLPRTSGDGEGGCPGPTAPAAAPAPHLRYLAWQRSTRDCARPILAGACVSLLAGLTGTSQTPNWGRGGGGVTLLYPSTATPEPQLPPTAWPPPQAATPVLWVKPWCC